MKRLPRIVKVNSVRNFVVNTLWNNGEVRSIDFKPMLEKWKNDKEERYAQLVDPKIFKTVTVSPEHTLVWPDVKIKFRFKGVAKEASLDLDPDVLYQESKLVSRYEQAHIGGILKSARVKAGLSQMQVAVNSGTSRTYISRIENEHSDIQLEVLYKIVRLGIGKDLKVSIQ